MKLLVAVNEYLPDGWVVEVTQLNDYLWLGGLSFDGVEIFTQKITISGYHELIKDRLIEDDIYEHAINVYSDAYDRYMLGKTAKNKEFNDDLRKRMGIG